MATVIFWASSLLLVFLGALAADIMGFFGSKKAMEVEGKTFLLTGASTGMGRGVAKLLAQKGANVVIVARNETRLAEAFKYISSAAKNPATQRFNAISADITSQAENERIITETTIWNHGTPPDIVWQIAGGAHPSLFLDTDMEIQHQQMQLNYWAAAYLAQATLRAWTKPRASKTESSPPSSGTRRFIMTSSIGALLGLAGYSPYSPAKAAMRSLADNLASEVLLYNGSRRSKDASIRSLSPPSDISIHLVMPGTITSPGYENENKTKHAVTKLLEKGDQHQNEDEVAKEAVKGLEQGGFIVTTNWAGMALRANMLGGSARNNIVLDTVLSWIVSIVWLFVGADMNRTVYNYGKQHGTRDVDESK